MGKEKLKHLDDYALQMRILSYEPKYSRGGDDIDDPLPNGSFYAHVTWEHRTINRRINEISHHDYGTGDLYFYKFGVDWQYEFRFLPEQFRCGSVLTNIDCDSFMRWFVDYIEKGEE